MNLATLQKEIYENIREVPDFPIPGVLFKDISPLLLKPDLVKKVVQGLCEPFLNQGITKIIGIESRGFILGSLMAQELNAGFVIVRKKGKLPPHNLEVSYDLEYGSAIIEMPEFAIDEKDMVLVHDDLLATGGTASAAAQFVQQKKSTAGRFFFFNSP
ncbi:MAG: adenine phosphoribosyltransferase [Bacteroidia bacterium]|nr:MAG: adenine phosphoribosyltransferase [Bacteroidia bacterium]